MDDISVICKDYAQFINVTNILGEWCINNKIEVNKKKSAVMFLGQDKNCQKTDLRGYSKEKIYKYLGLHIDKDINPEVSLKKQFEKLDEYLVRNKWLIKKYFTPKTLIQISQYFQFSRIGYV